MEKIMRLPYQALVQPSLAASETVYGNAKHDEALTSIKAIIITVHT
jgi:hypothetical protein